MRMAHVQYSMGAYQTIQCLTLLNMEFQLLIQNQNAEIKILVLKCCIYPAIKC